MSIVIKDKNKCESSYGYDVSSIDFVDSNTLTISLNSGNFHKVRSAEFEDAGWHNKIRATCVGTFKLDIKDTKIKNLVEAFYDKSADQITISDAQTSLVQTDGWTSLVKDTKIQTRTLDIKITDDGYLMMTTKLEFGYQMASSTNNKEQKKVRLEFKTLFSKIKLTKIDGSSDKFKAEIVY